MKRRGGGVDAGGAFTDPPAQKAHGPVTHELPDSAKLMISELSAWAWLLKAACPSRLGISTRPSSRTLPACSLRSAVTMAALGSGCVMLGLWRICSRLRMCLFTASRKSTLSRSDWPHDAHDSLPLTANTHATRQHT